MAMPSPQWLWRSRRSQPIGISSGKAGSNSGFEDWRTTTTRMASKSSFLDKVLGRIARLDTEGLQSVVQRLARERTFLETLFNTIEDGVLVVDETARIIYLNQAVSLLLGLPADQIDGQPLSRFLPELDWEKFSAFDQDGGQRVIRHEFEILH